MYKRLLMMLLPAAVLAGSMLGCGENGPGNELPVIVSLEASDDTVDVTTRVTLTCMASDRDCDLLAYAWVSDAGEIIGSGPTATWMAPESAGAYSIWVRVTDGSGGEVADTIEVSVTGGFLLASTSAGIIAISMSGGITPLYGAPLQVEVQGERIFVGAGGTIVELDKDGNDVRYVDVADQALRAYTFAVLPDAGFAFVRDSVYFLDATGALTATSPFPPPSAPQGGYNAKGLAVGNRLIVAACETHQVCAYDLTTHQGSVLRDLSNEMWWPVDIDYSDGSFYVLNLYGICKFAESGEFETLCFLPVGNVTGLVVVGSYAYAVTNMGGAMYKVNIYTGECETMLDDLPSAFDIEFVRLQA